MRVLSFVNISNRERISCDSGYIFQEIISAELVRRGCSYGVVGPIAPVAEGVTHFPLEFGSNKYQVRYNFEWEKVREIISLFRPEVILANQIEHAPQLKAICRSLGLECPLLSYAHYLPFTIDDAGKVAVDSSLNNWDLGESIIYTFLSGVSSSDCVLVHSNFARQMLLRLLADRGFQNPTPVEIAPPPADPRMLRTRGGSHSPRLGHGIYNHRLYAHYGTEFMVGVIEELAVRNRLSIDVLDPMGVRSAERQQMDASSEEFRKRFADIKGVKVRDDGAIRVSYREQLERADFALAPYRRACIWSMSCVDSMGMGVPVIAPRFACFPELLPKELLYDDQKEAVEIVNRVCRDRAFRGRISSVVEDIARELSVTRFVSTFLNVASRLQRVDQSMQEAA